MRKLFAGAAALVGAFIALASTAGCWIVYVDEPEMPENML